MLARTFLRLTALEALRPSALLLADGPWPTLGGAHVFDSRIDPIDDLDPDERRPLVAVYTEEHNLDRIAQSGPVFYKGAVDLVFELSVVASERDGENYVAGVAFTDAELDADLDLFEEQIFYCLHAGTSGALFRKIAKLPFNDWQSLPHRSSEEGWRLAMRTVRAKVSLRESCINAAPAAPLAGLDRLPQPLKDIAAALDGSSYLAKIVNALAAQTPTAPTAAPLQAVGLKLDLHAPQTAADPATAVVDVEASADNLQA